jgi:hypothetical protein
MLVDGRLELEDGSVTYYEGTHAEKETKTDLLFKWEGERYDHGNGYSNDQEIAADIENGLHNSIVL